MESKRIHAGRIFSESGWIDNGVITIDEQGNILTVTEAGSGEPAPNDLIVMPALIDTHIHGAAGADVMDASHEALNKISRHLARHGVGAFLATTVTAGHDNIEQALAQVRDSSRQGVDGAEILGAYLEGPFFTPKHKGAHPEALLHAPDKSTLEKWIEIADGTLKCVALAPEYPDAFGLIAWLRTQKIRVMLGHSNADYALTQRALQHGANGVVHCYNGMNGLHHREPGMVGAAFTSDGCDVELIVDGHHVHPAAVNVAQRCCGDRLLLISDAMRATGMPDGDYMLGEMLVHMKDGMVRTDSGGLAGSTLTLDNAVSHFSDACDISFEQAWMYGSLYPARALNVADVLGSIAPGKRANLVLLTPEHHIVATIVSGKLSYCAESHALAEDICI
jgi:N-acetylgalactosamine-6-phosphate deacetylase